MSELRLPSLSLLTVIANRLYFGINLCCLMEIGRPQFWIWFQVKKVDTAYIKHFVAMLPEVYELDMIFNFHKLTTRIKLQSAVNNFQCSYVTFYSDNKMSREVDFIKDVDDGQELWKLAVRVERMNTSSSLF
ncbi:hypothetical protein P8452_57157 [Trifolium repens]|nr:hypothetical protein P8452_57157 [Trifolium repens]